MDRDTFSIVFPDKSSQQYFTKLRGFEFNNAIVKAKIVAFDVPPGASALLKSTWVKIAGVLVEFREEGLLKQVCKMVGKLEEVYKGALRGNGPDRVRLKCRDPGAINCSIEFFFGDVGHLVSFEGEDRVMDEDEDSEGQDPKRQKGGGEIRTEIKRMMGNMIQMIVTQLMTIKRQRSRGPFGRI
jgi:hypothetical protein